MKRDKMMIEFSVQSKIYATDGSFNSNRQKISRLDTILAALLDDMGKSEE